MATPSAQPTNLTTTESSILLELNKILLTVNQINTSLRKTLDMVMTPRTTTTATATSTSTPRSQAAGKESPSQQTEITSLRANPVDVREVGRLVRALQEAIASGKGVFGKALGGDEKEGRGGDGEGSQAEEGEEGE